MTTPRIIETAAEMTAWAEAARARGERIAFVPTMGFLHAGHGSLLEEGRKRGQQLVLSIFVNPTQFAPTEDLDHYPRDLPGDLARAADARTDVAFVPAPGEMYPLGDETRVAVPNLSQGLCGERRPGHFAGVATVVLKLLHIVRPQVALFGEKDFQQLAVIRRMVRDLYVPVEIVGMPIVRETDGLAMSSRNAYLSPDERRRALVLSQGLRAAVEFFRDGNREASALVAVAMGAMRGRVDSIDYIEVRDAETLAPLGHVDRTAVIAVAAFVGKTRLIDNMRLG